MAFGPKQLKQNNLTLNKLIMKPEAIHKIKLVVSEEEAPRIQLKPGMQLKVEAIELVDQQLSTASIGAARICGGTTVCIAIIDVS